MPKRLDLPREAFLSHSSKDRRFVDGLSSTLRSHGIPVWYSQKNIVGAQQWHDEIGKALARCDWFVVVLTPHSVKSEWVYQELLYALNHRQYKGHIVPLLKRKCSYEQLSWTLDSFQRVDFTDNYDQACVELLRVWGMGYKKVGK